MTIELSKEAKTQAITSIEKYFQENMDERATCKTLNPSEFISRHGAKIEKQAAISGTMESTKTTP